MLVKDGKEYYPIALEEIRSGKGNLVYGRKNRKKSYVYIDLTGYTQKENEN